MKVELQVFNVRTKIKLLLQIIYVNIALLAEAEAPSDVLDGDTYDIS